jgi:hypothetical protein
MQSAYRLKPKQLTNWRSMMIQRRNFLTLAMAAIMTIVGIAAFDAKPAQAKSPQVEGRLVAKNVTTRQVTIRTQSGNNVVLTIPITAKIERNGVHTTLKAFKIGDFVQAKFDASGRVVIKFEGVGP